jgi:ribosomal protein L11 methylase PrmA
VVGGRDWVREVQEGWRPIRIGGSLLLRFTWHTEQDLAPFLNDHPGIRVMTLEGACVCVRVRCGL